MIEGQEPSRKDLYKAVARQRKDYRRTEERYFERSDGRWGLEYLQSFYGLKYCLDHVRSLPAKRVLDIGAQVTLAATQLQESELGEGLEFLATVLRKNPRIEELLGYKKTFVTSAESLKQVKDGSIGGVLACHSVSYSAAPKLVVEQLHRVLCERGIFKGAFATEEINNFGQIEYDPYEYIDLFRQRNFGVYNVDGLLLAVKNLPDSFAEDLLLKDAADEDNQYKYVPEPPL